MRRLWSYIILAFTAFISICTTFTNVLVKAESNIEYQDGREIVFKISDKENKDAEIAADASQNIASVMEQRLINSGVTNYEVDTVGNDMVKVIFSEQNTENYSNIIYYLAFNGKFALSTSNDVFAIGDELKTDKKAYLDTINSYPAVVLPINKDNSEFKAVIEAAQKQKDDGEGETSTNSDGEETKTVYLYLWADYEEGDVYEKTVEGNDNYDEKVANKVILKFNFTDGAFFPDDKEDKLTTAVNVDANGDGHASVSEVTNAYNTARYFVNLLNSEQLDYDVQYMYDKIVPAWTENIINYGPINAKVALSKTFIAAVLSLVVVTLLMVAFYKISASATFIITLTTLFSGLALSILFGVEFTLTSIIGFIATGIASVACSIIYFNKLKEECYKGRSLKKANNEASKKSLLPIVDINVILIILGVFAYALGGKLMMGFAAITVLGGLVSLILNTLVLKGAMWLLTNNTAFTGKYSIFGVDPKCVPDLLKEEKQTYFGAYADKDFTKNKKVVGIVSLLILVASIAGAVTFNSINGNPFNTPSDVRSSQIYFETTANESALNMSKVQSIIEKVYVYNNGEDEAAVALSTLVNDDGIETYSMTETLNQEGVENNEIKHTYYVITLKNNLNESTVSYYSDDATNKVAIGELLNEIVINENIDSKAYASFKMVNSYTKEENPNIGKVILATSVAMAVICIYLSLRYRLSRGLASVVVPLLTGAFIIGALSLTRTVTTSYIIAILPLVILIPYLFEIFFFNKEREMILEDKKHDNSIENRQEIMIKANSLAFVPISALMCASLLASLIFFGFGPASISQFHLVLILGILFSYYIVSIIAGPIASKLYSYFHRINLDKKPGKEKKKKNLKKQKSAEPEEAIFIGIND